MKSTIIIPNYNGIKYLEPCLQSVYKDTPHVPVIVVDNGSTDGSELLGEKYPSARFIRLPENTGFCHAVNLGVEAAETEYVILLNNDILVEPGFVPALERALDADKKVFSVNAKMRSMHCPEKLDNAGVYYNALGWAFDYGKDKYDGPAFRYSRDIFASCGGASAYRRELFLELGGLDELHFAYLEDVDIGYHARIEGYKNRYIPEAVVYHAGSAASGSRYNEFKTNLSSANSIYLIKKNMPLLQQLLNLPFLMVGFAAKIVFFCRKGLGKTYLLGLYKGFCKYYSEDGKKRRVKVRAKNLPNYLKIQWELWVNVVRRLL